MYVGFATVFVFGICVFKTSGCLGDQALSPRRPAWDRHPSSSLQKLLLSNANHTVVVFKDDNVILGGVYNDDHS